MVTISEEYEGGFETGSAGGELAEMNSIRILQVKTATHKLPAWRCPDL